jgi:outer membrane protein TolC
VFTIENRPDFGILMEEIDQAGIKLALARNELRPKLDLKGEIAKDIGPEGLGGHSRTATEVIMGISLKIPLQNRKAKGKLAETQAKLDELSIKQRYLGEKIRAEVAGIGIEVETARKLVDTTLRQRDLAGNWRRPSAAASSWDRATSSSSTSARKPPPTPRSS